MTDYPRDMVGYGAAPPQAQWPGGARIALQIVLNYEEGAENNIRHGDAASEAFLSEIIGAVPLSGRRHMNIESIYEYGSRAGFWRLMRRFEERRIPITVFAVAMALLRNPAAARAMVAGGTRSPATAGAGSTIQKSTRRSNANISTARSRRSKKAPGSGRSVGTPGGRARVPGFSSPRRAGFSMTPTPMPTICRIGSRSADAII